MGLLLLIWALPFLAIVLVVVLTIAGVAAGFALRKWRASVDARRRRPCPRCQAPAREEASGCPKCRVELEPRVYLVTSERI